MCLDEGGNPGDEGQVVNYPSRGETVVAAKKRRRKSAVKVLVCVTPGCGQRVILKGLRGLCVRCFADPVVRESVEMVVPVSRGKSARSVRPLPVPTAIRPGPNSGKVEVLAERVRLRQQLFHPDDAK